MPELVIEIRLEDMPARVQQEALAQGRSFIHEALHRQRLSPPDCVQEAIYAAATPHRLLWAVDGLARRQEDQLICRRGPRAEAPQAAIDGFMRAQGLTHQDQLSCEDTPKGRFWFFRKEQAGQAAEQILPPLVVDMILNLRWPRGMRWGWGQLHFIRPITGILALFAGRALAGGLALGDSLRATAAAYDPAGGDIPYAASSYGHPRRAPEAFAVTDLAQLRKSLAERFVLLSLDERKQRIARQAEAQAAAHGFAVSPNAALLEELARITQWPEVGFGRIDERFLTLPPEVLRTALAHHQKCLSLVPGKTAAPKTAVPKTVVPTTGAPTLAPGFLFVSDLAITPTITAGYERVLRARLEDALFFWQRDRRQPLADFLPALAGRLYHQRLGDLHQRAERLSVLGRRLAAGVAGADPEVVARAALLAKADLASAMVGEFPELQGCMGGHYAREDDGHEVAAAIAQHYWPLSAKAPLPETPSACAVALTDKIEMLAAFFAIGAQPTGSGDPYALRRAALGCIRIIHAGGRPYPLRPAFAAALELLGEGRAPATRHSELLSELCAFMRVRLRVWLRDRGMAPDRLAALIDQPLRDGEDLCDPYRMIAQVEALDAFLAGALGQELMTAYRRAANITRAESQEETRPPTLGAPTLGAPTLGAPTLGAPTLGAPTLGAPTLGAPSPASLQELLKRNQPAIEPWHHSPVTRLQERSKIRQLIMESQPSDKAYLQKLLERYQTALASLAAHLEETALYPDAARSHSKPEFLHPAEARLRSEIKVIDALSAIYLHEGAFQETLEVLSRLRRPVDDFFENVTVNDPDPDRKSQRLALLRDLVATMERFGDFHKIVLP